MCIIFESTHSIFALPGWHHKCTLKKEGVSHFGLVFWWRDGEKRCRWEGKKRKEWQNIVQKLCVHTVNGQTNKQSYVYLFTCLCMYFPIVNNFFFYLLTCTFSLNPFTKIPVRNDLPHLLLICICDVIHEEQKCFACFPKRIHMYTTEIMHLFSQFFHIRNFSCSAFQKSFVLLQN